VQTYVRDGAMIQLWTESGSMTLPIDIVRQITEDKVFASPALQSSTAPSPVQVQDEEAPEMQRDQRRPRSLYLPAAKSQPESEADDH
jgi:hypothetical protein